MENFPHLREVTVRPISPIQPGSHRNVIVSYAKDLDCCGGDLGTGSAQSVCSFETEAEAIYFLRAESLRIQLSREISLRESIEQELARLRKRNAWQAFKIALLGQGGL